MWSPDEIRIVLEASDGATSLVKIETPAGFVEIIGEVSFVGKTMRVDRSHIDGPGAGRLGRHGLNVIASKLLLEANVDEIIIQGSVRTTGRNPGRAPRSIRFPRRLAAETR